MSDEELMRRALVEAEEGLREGAMPIGAVLARGDRVLASAHWRGTGSGLLSHPEHVVLLAADASIEWTARREATLVTTLEPCLMCMGAAMSFGLGRVVYALPAPADGAANVASAWQPRFGHPTDGVPYSVPAIAGGVGEVESRELILAWLGTGVSDREADFARLTLGAVAARDLGAP